MCSITKYDNKLIRYDSRLTELEERRKKSYGKPQIDERRYENVTFNKMTLINRYDGNVTTNMVQSFGNNLLADPERSLLLPLYKYHVKYKFSLQ